MGKSAGKQKRGIQDNATRKPSWTGQIFMILLVLGILWLTGKGILFLINFVLPGS